MSGIATRKQDMRNEKFFKNSVIEQMKKGYSLN